jgi:iron complex outermembrane receptor protein
MIDHGRRLFGAGVWILAMAVLGGASFADNLSGRVLDPSGAAVGGARLRLFDRSTGALLQSVSAPDGTWEFRNIPSGEYLLEGMAGPVSLAGSRRIVLAGDQALDLELGLSGPSVEVLVTATGTAQSIVETAKAIDVVTSEDIALRNELSISEAIRHIPGVRVQTLEGPGSFTAIRTRGLRGQDTAVLIDGLRFRDAASPQGDATAFFETMTTVDTERIEFLRGSGSSLYGSNAMAGVVNITSREGRGVPRGEIRLEGGGLGLLRGVVGVGGGLADDRLTYSGTATHINITRGVRDGNPYRNSAGQGSLGFDLTPAVSITGRLWWAGDYLASTESPAFPDSVLANFPASGQVRAIALRTDQLELYEQQQPFDPGNATFVPGSMDRDGRRVASFLTGSTTLEHRLAPETSYRVAYQGVDTHRTLLDGPARGGDFEPASGTTAFTHDGRTDMIQARIDTRAGDLTRITAGYEFERERYDNRATDAASGPEGHRVAIGQRSHSVFVQDQIRLADSGLQLSVGGRAQFFQLGTPAFSNTSSPYETAAIESPPAAFTGDAALAYFFERAGTKLRAHVGNSYRAPSPYERFGGDFSSFSGDFDYWGDPRLAPERSVGVDAGIDQWLFDRAARLSATVFYTNLQETVIFDFATFPAATDPFGRFGGYRNGGGGIARGVELSTEFSPRPGTQVLGGYTYTNSDSRTPTIGTDYFQVPGVSDHMFTLAATQWIGRALNVTFDLFAASDYVISLFGSGGRQMIFDGPVKADVVTRYDVALGNDRTGEIYVKIENVLNRRYYENGFLGPGAWAVAGFRFRY